MKTIYTKYDAKEFLDSAEGGSLMAVRAQRDRLAKEVKSFVYGETEESWLEDCISYSPYQSSSYGRLLEKFKEEKFWHMCAVVEAFRMLCLRAAKLERQECGTEISRTDYDLVNA